MEKEIYDYIVVGTGPGGSVMANRLSADGKNKVLVLEAGENYDTNPMILSSKTSALYSHYPEFFWPGVTEAQKELGGKSIEIGHGRLSGGGSSINGEMYVRPSPFVLNKWVKAAGDKWSPENATKHYRELENFNGKLAKEDVHGYSGDLHIRQNLPQRPPLTEKLISAMEKATGLPRVDDYNDPRTSMGPFEHYQMYQKPDGTRASGSICFLNEEVRKRPNLTVLNQATATKVLFGDDKTAQGVEYIHKGVTMQATANKKVIISAGIHSVKLLMLSGIGPRETLDKYNIPTVYNNENVGKNLAYDGVIAAIFTCTKEDGEAMAEYDPNGFWIGGAALPDPRGPRDSKERSIQMFSSYLGDGKFQLVLLQVNPKSRGVSTILSDDPLKLVSLDYRFLSDPDDMNLLKSLLKDYMARTGEEIHKIDPACELVSPTKEQLTDDAKLEEFIRNGYMTSWHDQCQLKMGKESDGAVVDSSCQVYGVKNLMVVDASVIPYHTDGNTSAPTYLIAQTIATELLAQA